MEQNQESKSFQEKKDHMDKPLKGISVSEIPRKTPQSSPNAFIISKTIFTKASRQRGIGIGLQKCFYIRCKGASQRNELLNIVHELIFENCRYTDEQFKLAKATRETLMVDAKKYNMEDKTMKEAGHILKELKSIQVNVDYKDSIFGLKELLSRADELHEELECTDKCTGVMQDLLRHVTSVRDAFSDEIKLNQRIFEVIKNLDKTDKRKSKVFIKRMELQKQKLGKGFTEERQRKGNLDNKVKENVFKSEKEWRSLNGKLDLKTVSGKNMKGNLILKTEDNNIKLEGIDTKGELESEKERLDVDCNSLYSDDEIKDCDEKIKRQLNKTKELDSQLHEIKKKEK